VDVPNEYVPPPSVVSRNVVLEGQLNVWNELRKFDQSNTGKGVRESERVRE
jgi:hypothetical protein